MPQPSYPATPPPPADPDARQRINLRAMRRSAKPVFSTSFALAPQFVSKSTEGIRSTLLLFTGVGAFGAAASLSSYYTAASSTDAVNSLTLISLAWSFVAYLGTGIVAIIWQIGSTLYPGVTGRYVQYFSTPVFVVAACYTCILFGTAFLAIALVTSPLGPVRVAGLVLFLAVGAPVCVVLHSLLHNYRRFKLRGLPISVTYLDLFLMTGLPNFYDHRLRNRAFAWNDDPTGPLTLNAYDALRRTAETMATTTRGRDIARFLLLCVRFASAAEYVLAIAPEDEDGTLDAKEMAERIVYASRALHATRDVPDAITDVEREACSEFLRLSEMYGPLVSQLSAIDPSFWDSPLEDRTRQVYFLHKASGRATAEDAAIHSATAAAEAPHVIVQMDEETAGAGNAAEGSTRHDAVLSLHTAGPPTVSPSPLTPAEASNSGPQEGQQVAAAASDSSMASLTGADIALAVRTPLPLHARSVGAIDELDDI